MEAPECELLALGPEFETALATLRQQLQLVIEGSHLHPMRPCCAVDVPAIRERHGPDVTWREVLLWRIAATWDLKEELADLVWLDDKLEQVDRVRQICGEQLHLPILLLLLPSHCKTLNQS